MNLANKALKGFSIMVSNPLVWALFVIVFMSAPLAAQGLPGGDPDVPVDGGIVTVVGGAVLFGLRQLRKERNNDPS